MSCRDDRLGVASLEAWDCGEPECSNSCKAVQAPERWLSGLNLLLDLVRARSRWERSWT